MQQYRVTRREGLSVAQTTPGKAVTKKTYSQGALIKASLADPQIRGALRLGYIEEVKPIEAQTEPVAEKPMSPALAPAKVEEKVIPKEVSRREQSEKSPRNRGVMTPSESDSNAPA